MVRTYRPVFSSKSTNATTTSDNEEIVPLLKSLKPYANVSFLALEEEPRRKFMAVINAVNQTKGTNEYRKLYDHFVNVFGDITDVKPGTVAGYILGCHLAKTNPYGACDALCAGSAPDPDLAECTYSVYWAKKNNNGYELFLINQVPPQEQAVVYVPIDNKADDFLGFNDNNLVSLSPAKNIRLIGYTKDGKYVDILPTWTPLNSVKRVRTRQDNITTTLVIVYGLLILLLFLFIMTRRQ